MTTPETQTKNPRSKEGCLTLEQKLAAKVQIRVPYLDAPDRDKQFLSFVEQMRQNILMRRAGGGVKQCALVLMGESGTGKSKMLSHYISHLPEFQLRPDAQGKMYSPYLSIEMPASCNTKSVAIALLAGLGVRASNRASEFKLYTALKRVLKENGIEYLVIDEMQHAIRGTKDATIQKVQDVFKSLLQIDDWPIHIIFAGTHALKNFLEGDRQIANRCRVMRLSTLNYRRKANVTFVNGVIEKVIVQTAKMDIGWEDKDKLTERLIRASSSALGTLIQNIQEACFLAIDDDRTIVTLSDFAQVYKSNTGCMKRDNIFTSGNWEKINPANAVSDLTEDE